MIRVSKHGKELRLLQLCQEKKKDYSVCDYFPFREVEFFLNQLFCAAVMHR